jgi:diacylglycerol kinase family enzyme
MTAIILVNPHAAGGRARKLYPQVVAWCQSHPALAQHAGVVMPETISEALTLLKQLPSPSRVVIVGGDGTLNQMLPSLVNRDFEVGLVPYGSGNDCARSWGLHTFKWQKALEFALTAAPQTTDMGKVQLANGQTYFFHSSLAIGFDASVGNRALAGPNFLTGLPRYLVATLRELFRLKNWHLSVQLDQHFFYEGICLLGSSLNTSTYGGGMPAVPHARIDDGQLNLLLAGQFNRAQTLFMLPKLLIGKHLGHARIQCKAFTQANISSTEELPIAADGETLGHAQELIIQVLPGALKAIRV